MAAEQVLRRRRVGCGGSDRAMATASARRGPSAGISLAAGPDRANAAG